MGIVLVVGGTGTLGKHVVPLLLQNPQIERIRILSRGEHTQSELEEKWKSPRVDFFIGDVRDSERVLKASRDCAQVFHFAAMKSVDKAEYDPWEAVQTNIEGTKNVIEACLENKVEKAIFTSTDKAVEPLNIYGASKLVAEKLFISANMGKHRSRFSVCRYGNVLSSNGSVIEKWKKAQESGRPIYLTHEAMTRFFLLPTEAAEFVLRSMGEMTGGEVFVPKMKSTTIINLARAAMLSFKLEDANWIGIRPGEKLHETLISNEEVFLTTDVGDKYIRWPNSNLFPVMKRGAIVEKGFSSLNAERFTLDELKEMICKSESGSSQKSAAAIWEGSTTFTKPSIPVLSSASMPSSSSFSQMKWLSPEAETSGAHLSCT